MLLIVNLQFSDFQQFGNLAIWTHSVNGTTTQIDHLLFLEKFKQTKTEIFGHFRRLGKVGPLRLYQNYVFFSQTSLDKRPCTILRSIWNQSYTASNETV